MSLSTDGEPTISDEAIAKRAYQLWEARGRPHGNGDDDWQLAKKQLQAEAHRRQRPILRLLSRLRSRAAI